MASRAPERTLRGAAMNDPAALDRCPDCGGPLFIVQLHWHDYLTCSCGWMRILPGRKVVKPMKINKRGPKPVVYLLGIVFSGGALAAGLLGEGEQFRVVMGLTVLVDVAITFLTPWLMGY